jgi:hypothetical protein
MTTHVSVIVRQRVLTDDILRERVASLLAKYADYILALGASATEAQTTWARYVLAGKDIPDAKATSMMWLVCWNAAVRDTPTADIADQTISGIIEPAAILY